MAHIATNASAPLSLGKTLAAPFVAFYDALIRLSMASSRARQIEQFNAMSDAELAEMGLTRETIVRHVFRDYAHI